MVERLNLFWRCAKCGMDQLGPVGDLPDAGIPICSECGDDMARRRYTGGRRAQGLISRQGSAQRAQRN
jgi:hypothetical protein